MSKSSVRARLGQAFARNMNAQEILQNLKPTGEWSEMKGGFIWGGRSVSISVEPDEATLEDALAFATRLLENFEDFVRRSKAELLKECFAMYNDDWRREGDPVLTVQEFLGNFHLTAINILGDKSADFFYNESGMFGNHCMIPQIFDGENFDGVMMYG